MKYLYKYRFVFYSIMISIIVLYPYLSTTLNYEHDTFFHLSRIEGYAKAISNYDFLPSIYPLKNNNYGYISPSFYCDILLLIPAILYNLNIPIIICYKVLLMIFTLISCFTIKEFISKFSKNDYSIYLGISLFIFATYRLTNIYVRGAIGEICAYSFLPIVLLGIYEFIFENKYKNLVIGFSLLLLTHNITFLLACMLFFIMIIINYRLIFFDRYKLINLIKAIILTLLLVSFFLFPMIEQLISQEFILENRKNASLMQTSSMHIYQFFQNRLNFNISKQDTSGMIVNIGLFLTFLPLFYLFVDKFVYENKFIKQCMILGYLSLMIQSSMIPWESFNILSFMQFVFRLNNISIILLVLPASIYITNVFFYSKYLIYTLLLLIIFNSIYLLNGVSHRTNIITNSNTYNELINGSIIDPYYSAYYVRTELAGADYLPVNYFDYKENNYGIYNCANNTIISIPINNYNNLIFNIFGNNSVIRIPKTYYKGYKLYGIKNNEYHEIEIYKSNEGLINFNNLGLYNDFVLTYEKTLIKHICNFTSVATLIVFFGICLYRKIRKLF